MNAVVHGFEGRSQGKIAIRVVKVQESACELTVSDNGCGMPSEILDKIFEPFYTTKRGKGGSGLGLSIVYNLVTQQLGGAIRCESKQGEGSRFVLVIPGCQ